MSSFNPVSEHDIDVKLQAAMDQVSQMIIGKMDVIRHLFAALLARGHLLLEDVPGVGKSRLVRAFADVTGCDFRRIQFTPDILPTDVTGMVMLQRETFATTLRKGPIFSQIVLADELNRASPRTQSALLEAMEERQVTIDGNPYPLPMPFMVVATQNPIEFEATFPLPEAQLDRFMIRISMGYPSMEDEVLLYEGVFAEMAADTKPLISPEDITLWQNAVEAVFVHPSLKDYVARLVRQTRQDPQIRLGISPRGGIHLIQAAKAMAFLAGRRFVVPDDLQTLWIPVLAHRVLLSSEASFAGRTVEMILRTLLEETPVPPFGDHGWTRL